MWPWSDCPKVFLEMIVHLSGCLVSLLCASAIEMMSCFCTESFLCQRERKTKSAIKQGGKPLTTPPPHPTRPAFLSTDFKKHKFGVFYFGLTDCISCFKYHKSGRKWELVIGFPFWLRASFLCWKIAIAHFSRPQPLRNRKICSKERAFL